MRGDVTAAADAAASPGSPRSAANARLDDLQELTHGLRSELVARGEFLPPTWVEEAAAQLKDGRLQGWVLSSPDGPGLAFLSPRPGRAYGHVHVTRGPHAVERAEVLLAALAAVRPDGRGRLDVGLSGFSEGDEDALLATVRPPDASILVRLALETSAHPPPSPTPLPPEFRRVPFAAVALADLARLDWIAFQGTADETLVADSPAEDRRVLEEIAGGLLGRFLPEASCVILDANDQPAGFVLTAEQTPRRAVFLDLVVRPDLRRRRLGDHLLRWAIRAISALGHEAGRLWVSERNAPARALYGTLGFRPVGRALIYRFAGPPVAPAQPHRSP